MQDWDTRIKVLKTDIQIAREKYVVPFMKSPPKPAPIVNNVKEEDNIIIDDVEKSSEKLYENKDLTSSLDLLNKNEAVTSEEVPKVDVEEAVASEEAPKVDVAEAVASEEVPKVDVAEAVASEEAPKVDVAEGVSLDDNIKNKKTELELLEERDENDLSEEEEDRMYELRLLRAQKNMHKEVREAEEAELAKADEEIAHLKTLLKPKPKKLPKGYVE